MFLERFYDRRLAQASYMVGCTATGEALVIDPNRDVGQYIEEADRQGLRITHVTETHVHADFVSATRTLAKRAGAMIHLSAEGGSDWQYDFAKEDGAVLLRDGGHFLVGNVRIDVLHTPGHTPEHLSFMVTDTAAADQPMGVFTGDFVFVGDVGRPDLLEKATGVRGTMEEAARTLFRSIQKFKALPDYLQIWPGHGAGSACGKALGAVPQSTLGYEKLFNWAFAHDSEDAFVHAVLAGQPEPPKYFAEMKRINRHGPLPGDFRRPPRLPETRLIELVEAGALVIDTRDAGDYAAAHVTATINIPLDGSFHMWAGWLVPYERDFYLIVDDERCPDCVDEVVKDLAKIGLDRIGGYFGSHAIAAWGAEGRQLGTVGEITAAELAESLSAGDVTVIDVRGRSEWEAGRLPDVPNIPLGELPERLGEIPRDKPVVVHCQSGARAAIAASVLKASGITNVVNLRGGFDQWKGYGHPVERGAAGAVERS